MLQKEGNDRRENALIASADGDVYDPVEARLVRVERNGLHLIKQVP